MYSLACISCICLFSLHLVKYLQDEDVASILLLYNSDLVHKQRFVALFIENNHFSRSIMVSGVACLVWNMNTVMHFSAE